MDRLRLGSCRVRFRFGGLRRRRAYDRAASSTGGHFNPPAPAGRRRGYATGRDSAHCPHTASPPSRPCRSLLQRRRLPLHRSHRPRPPPCRPIRLRRNLRLPTPTSEPTSTAETTPTPEPEAASTPVPPDTPTPEPTATLAPTPDPTATATPTPEPTATATSAPEPTATATPTPEPATPENLAHLFHPAQRAGRDAGQPGILSRTEKTSCWCSIGDSGDTIAFSSSGSCEGTTAKFAGFERRDTHHRPVDDLLTSRFGEKGPGISVSCPIQRRRGCCQSLRSLQYGRLCQPSRLRGGHQRLRRSGSTAGRLRTELP